MEAATWRKVSYSLRLPSVRKDSEIWPTRNPVSASSFDALSSLKDSVSNSSDPMFELLVCSKSDFASSSFSQISKFNSDWYLIRSLFALCSFDIIPRYFVRIERRVFHGPDRDCRRLSLRTMLDVQ
jgi:hypothetical protein